MRSFNTASGNAQLQHGTIAYIHSDVLSFNTASGNAQLQQCLCVKPENYVGFGFNTASGNAQLQPIRRRSCSQLQSFNTASGNAQLQQ